jgi:hypothetical protein
MSRLLVVLALLGLAGPTSAQTDGLRIDRFLPPPTAGDGLALPTAQTVGHLEPAFGLVLDYALDPLVARSGQSGEGGSVIAHRAVANVMAALGVLDRLEFHLRVPVVLQAGNAPTIAGTSFAAPDLATLADPAFGGSVRLTDDEPEGVHLGALVEGFLPLTAPSGYASDQEFSLRGLLLLDYAVRTFALEVVAGASYRPERQLPGYRSASELHLGIGGRVAIGGGFDVLAELALSTGLRDDLAFQTAGTNLELLAGARYRLDLGLSIELGVGVGFLRAPGTPAFRAFAGFRWDPPPVPPADADGDGVVDELDPCPSAAEDLDRFEDADGCPDPDDDGDGVSDLLDACDREAEDADGWQDGDGCLDPDDDADGVADTEDACPRAPGGRASEGCPRTLRVEGDAIVLVREIDFAAGEATLVPSNGPLLDELSAVMLLDTAGHRWRVVVRASGGRRDDGRALAEARAAAIVRSLVGRGVAPEALEAGVGAPRDDDYVRIETLPPASE